MTEAVYADGEIYKKGDEMMIPDAHTIHKQFAEMILTVKNKHLKDEIKRKFLQTNKILKALKKFKNGEQSHYESEDEDSDESESQDYSKKGKKKKKKSPLNSKTKHEQEIDKKNLNLISLAFYQISAYFQVHLANLQAIVSQNYQKRSQFFSGDKAEFMLRVFFTKILIWKEKSEITMYKAFRRIVNEFKQIVWEEFYDVQKPLMDKEEMDIFRDNFQHQMGFSGWNIDSGVTTQRKQAEVNNMSFDKFSQLEQSSFINDSVIKNNLDMTNKNVNNILAGLNDESTILKSKSRKTQNQVSELDDTVKKSVTINESRFRRRRPPIPEEYYQNGCHKYSQTEEDMTVFKKMKQKELELSKVIEQYEHKEQKEIIEYHEAVVKSVKERNLLLDLELDEVLDVKEWDTGLDCKFQKLSSFNNEFQIL